MTIADTIQLVIALISAVGVVATLVAALVAVWVQVHGIRSELHGVKQQLFVAIFNEYTKRYAHIMDGLPPGARDPKSTIRLDEVNDDMQERVLNVGRRYFNLCSEEMWLADSGYLDPTTWEIWHDGIRETMRLPLMLETWNRLKAEYTYFSEFCEFMEGIVNSLGPKDPRLRRGS